MAEKIPASIRYNNPGAMWGGKHANKWGATNTVGLNDGTGQGNTIGVFPTKVQGAAAQFDLWRIGYVGMSLSAAIRKWSGGNSSSAYMNFLNDKTGIRSTDTVTATLLAGPKGLALMKAQAQWEAGKPYPMSDAEWITAQNMVFPGANPAPPPDIPKATADPAPVVTSRWSAIVAAIVSIFKRPS